MKRKFIPLLFSIFLLNLIFAGTCFASDVWSSNSTTYSGYSTDFGYKAWTIYNNYDGNQFDQNGYQVVDNHDFTAYCTVIYDPAIGNGSDTIMSVSLQDSGGSAIQTNYSFSSGNINSYYLNPYYYNYPGEYSYAWLQAYPSGSYRIQYITYFDNSNFIGANGDAYNYTSYF